MIAIIMYSFRFITIKRLALIDVYGRHAYVYNTTIPNAHAKTLGAWLRLDNITFFCIAIAIYYRFTSYIYDTCLHVMPVLWHEYIQVISNEVVHISVLEVVKRHIGSIVLREVASMCVPHSPVIVQPPPLGQVSSEVLIVPSQHLCIVA